MGWIRGGVTAAKGFTAHGVHSGVKRFKTKDLAIILSDRPANACGVFTTNKMKAPCVSFNQKQLRKGKAQVIITNSGNANCLTGKRGEKDNARIARVTAIKTGIPLKYILVASTGLIGVPLPIQKILGAILALVAQAGRKGHQAAAQAILTTDNHIKEAAVAIGGAANGIRIGAMAKGAGMIYPKMTLGPNHATMLCFITTDAVISTTALRQALLIKGPPPCTKIGLIPT